MRDDQAKTDLDYLLAWQAAVREGLKALAPEIERARRWQEDMIKAGWEEVTNHLLLNLHCGGRWRERFVAVQISPDGRSIFAKVEEPPHWLGRPGGEETR